MEDNETVKRRRLILKIFLYSFLLISFVVQVLIFIIDILNWINTGKLSASHFTPLIIFVLLLLLLKLANKGRAFLAGLLFLSILMIAAIQTSIHWGVDQPQNIAMYSLIIIMSGAVIRPSFAIIVSILISSVLSIIFILQNNGIIVPEQNWRTEPTTLVDFIAMLALYVIMAIISWLFSREIIKGLKRAWKSEQEALKLASELQKEKDNLEVKVQKRTKELRESQLRELTRINNLAEFGRLSAGLLHDIKNPLTVISLNLDSLRNGPKSKTIELINRSLLAAKTAETIIKSSQEQLVTDEEKQQFDLIQGIKNTLVLTEHRAEREKVSIVFEGPKKITLNGYPSKFSRVMANLVMNAIDSFNEIKRVKRKIEIKILKNKSQIIVEVSDNGCGIRDKDKLNIFQPLFSKKENKDRMGLGLYGSNKIVKDYFGGKMLFESTYGEGTKFKVIIPIK